MKQFLTLAIFALLVGGIVFYGYSRIVLITVLVGCGLFFGSGIVWGVYEAMVKRWLALQALAPPDVGVQARALRTIPSSVGDAELSELRRLAGLN